MTSGISCSSSICCPARPGSAVVVASARAQDASVPDVTVPETPSIETPAAPEAPAAEAPWTGFTDEEGSITVETPTETFTDITQNTQLYVGTSANLDIPEGYHVNINQASSNYLFVAKAAPDADPTFILGRLTADGRVIIIDRNGVFTGPNSVIDVAGIIMTTGDIKIEDLRANDFGQYEISNITEGAINLNGNISVADAGLAAFVAPSVSNAGVINATMGKVALASGETVTLDLYGDDLVEVAVPGSVADALIENSGSINANGGVVQITAAQAKDVVDNIINVSGIVDVSSVSTEGGKIVLSGGDMGSVTVSGILDATGDTGGEIVVTGEAVGALDGAVLDASGKNGGGKINVGGAFQGGDELPGSEYTYIDRNAILRANAEEEGDGGDIVVWSDGTTQFLGDIEAKGGANGGNGGNVEVSGKGYLGFRGFVDTSAADGSAGTLLLDPTDFEIRLGSGDTTPDGDSTGDLTKQWNPGSPDANNSSNVALNSSYIYESEIEGQNTNFLFVADRNITVADGVTGTSDGVIQLQNDRSLEMRTNNNAANAGGIDLTTNDIYGSNLLFKTTGTGGIKLQAGVVGTTVSNIVTSRLESQNGNIFVDTNNGSINANGSITVTGTGNVTMDASSLSAPLTGDVFINAPISIQGGTVQLSASHDVNINNPTTPNTGSISTKNGNVILQGFSPTGESNVLIDGAITTLGGDVTVIAGDDIRVRNVINSSGNWVITGNDSGNVSLRALGNNAADLADVEISGLGQVITSDNGAFTSFDGTVNIEAQEVKIATLASGQRIDATGGFGNNGNVTITRSTDGTIGVGSGAAAASSTNMEILQTELAEIDADSLTIGSNKVSTVNVNGANTQTGVVGPVTFNAQLNSGNFNDVNFIGTNAFNGLTVNADDSAVFSNNSVVNSNGAVTLNLDTNNEGVGALIMGDGSKINTSDDDVTVNTNQVFIGTGGWIDATGGNILINNKSIFASGGANTLRTSGDGTITLTQYDGNTAAKPGSASILAGVVGLVQNAIDALQNTGTGQNTLYLKNGTASANAGVVAGDNTFVENVTVDQANLKIDGDAGITIAAASNANNAVINVTASNVNVDPIIVDGNNLVNYGISATGAGFTGFVSDGNTFRETLVAGIQLNGSSGTATVENNFFEGTATRGVDVTGLTGSTTVALIENNDMGVVGGSVVNGVRVTNGINNATLAIQDGNDIRSTGDGVLVNGAIANTANLTVNGNSIRASGGHGVNVTGNMANSLVIINGNTLIDAEQDGVRFGGTMNGGFVQVSQNAKIDADDSGIRFEGAISNGAVINMHDNVINANLDGGIIGSGIFFNGTVDGSTVNIGDGNNIPGPGDDGSNIINVLTNFDAGTPGPDDGLDGIHFDKNVNNSTVLIDGNRIGYTGLPGVGPVVQTQITDDGIEFTGNVTGNTNVTISDNRISAFDNGILFNGNVGGGGVTRVTIGGQDAAEHGNTITAGTDGIRFNGLVTGEALIEASNNYVVATRDAIRFQGLVNNAKTTGGLSEEEIHLYKNEFHGGQNGVHFVSGISGVNNDVRIHDNRNIIGTAQNGILVEGAVNDTDVQIYANGNNAGAVRGGQNGVLFTGAIENNANVEVRDNGVIQGEAVDGVRFDGPINGTSVVSVNGNDRIVAFEDGVSFNGLINGNATINVNGNYSNTSNDGIAADDHGVYFAQNIANATVNIDDNNIRANLDGGEIGSGIFFDGTIQNATVNIGNGNNTLNGNIIHVADNTFGSDNNLDGIHFNKAIGTGAVINIDANTIGGRGIPNSIAIIDSVTDDGIEFRGAVNGNADINITDNYILGDDDGIRFFANVGDTATVTIGGSGHGNEIRGTSGHGIVFENTVSGQALVDISNNARIQGGLDGIAFEGVTSNALLPAGASQQEINIANNSNIIGNNNGIRFQQNVNTDLHDIRIAGNTITGNTVHGVNFNGNIGGNESQIWIVDGNTITGDQDGIHFNGTVTNEANVRINDNTSIVARHDDAIDFVGNISGGALVQINGNDNIQANNTSGTDADNGIEFAGINGSTVEIIGNNHGIHANDHGIWVEGNVTNANVTINDNIITANEDNNGTGDGIRFDGFIDGNSVVQIGDGLGGNRDSGFSNVISGAIDGIRFNNDIYNAATINIDGNRIGFTAASLAGPVSNARLSGNGINFADNVYDASNINITDNWIRVEDDGVRFGGNVYGTGKILIGGDVEAPDGNNIDAEDDGIQFNGTVSQQRLVEISYNTVNADNDGVRFTGQTSNALNPVTVQDEIWINENTITAGRNGINVEQNVSQDRHDIRITGNWIDALNEDGIRFGGSIDDESQIWILNNDSIIGDRKGIYVHGTISGDALFEVVDNTYIRGEDEDGIDFNGDIFGNAVIRVNDNDHIQGDDNGIEFASVGGSSTVEILRNNHGIHALGHGIYFGGHVQNQADVDIHDNIINADDNDNGNGDGIHFAGNIQNQATVNIGDGNGANEDVGGSNIISGHDGIHFAGHIQNQAQIVIDGNRLGFDGASVAGPYSNDRLGNDGIQVEGELRNQASFVVTDNHIRAAGDGISFLDDLENGAFVLIGGVNDGNTINANEDGVQFEGDILNSSLVEISHNNILSNDGSGIVFNGDTSNADGIFPFRDDEILIAENDIEADEYGIVFFGHASGERHDIMIRDNDQIHGHGEHGIAHFGGIDDAELRILDNDDIFGEIDGIHIAGAFTNDALIRIDDNTIDTNDGDGVEVTQSGGAGGVDLNITDNHIHFVGDNGIEVTNVNDGFIAFNNIHDTGTDGIRVQGSEDTQIRWNYIHDIGDDGVDLRDSDGSNIENNGIWWTRGDGIQVRDSNGIIIDDNFIRFAGDDGIDYEDGIFSAITDNNIRFVNHNGIEINDSAFILIDDNEVADADEAGIFIDPSAVIFVTNNDLHDNDIGLHVDGPGNGYINVTGNLFTDNRVGGRFESGIIDLTGISSDPAFGGFGNKFIGGQIGLEFDDAGGRRPQLSLVRTGGFFAGGYTYDGNPYDTFDGVNIPGDPGLNFGGTIGSQYFEGQSQSFVTLRSGTFVDPGTGNAIWLDASDSTFFMPGPGGGLITGDVLTQAQFDFLESMFRHWPDANNRGIFWFGAVPADLGIENDKDFFEDLDPFNGGVSGLNVTITGLPRVSGFAPASTGAAGLNAIAPAAGDETPADLANIEPAAGGEGAQNVSCWGDAVSAAGTGGPVNYSYGGTFEESIAAAASCGAQSF